MPTSRATKGRQAEPVRRIVKDPVEEDEGFKVVGDRSRGKVTLQASAATPAKGLRASQKKGDRALGSDERGTRGRFESLSSQDEDDGDEEDDQGEEVQPAVVSEAEPEEEAGKTLTTSESVSLEDLVPGKPLTLGGLIVKHQGMDHRKFCTKIIKDCSVSIG